MVLRPLQKLGGDSPFVSTEGIYVIFDLFLNFLLYFLPSRNSLGIFEFFFFTKVHVV